MTYIAGISKELLRPQVKIVSSKICRRCLLNRGFFARRNFGLELVGDAFGDLALNGKHISQVAIIGLGPQMCVVPRIDELRVDPHFVSSPLHTSFDHMCYSKLLSDLAQISASNVA